MNHSLTSVTQAWVVAGLLLLGPLAAPAQTVLVGPTRPYPTLRAAVLAGAVVAGTTVRIDNGTYTDVSIIENVANVTITSTSGRAGGVVFDNQNQGNLALGGKSIILVRNSPGFAAVGLRFKDIGLDGPAGVAQQGNGAGNQAGLRFEALTAPGSARVSYCSFDGCVTGVFAPDDRLDLTIDHCDFGYVRPNGQARDGYSHDAYVATRSLTCINNNWYGDPYANNCKSRAVTNTISGGYNANSNGRCVELPACGRYTVTGGIYVGAGAGQQPFAYGAENQNNGVFSGTITGVTLRIGVTNATIWNNAAGSTMAFSNTTQEWYGTGTVPLILRGPGLITGLATSGPAIAPTLPAAPGPVSSAAPLAARSAGDDAAAALYPNPARDYVTIPLPAGADAAQVEVRDALARRVAGATFAGVAGQREARLPLGGLPGGVYSVTVQRGGVRAVRRLVVAW